MVSYAVDAALLASYTPDGIHSVLLPASSKPTPDHGNASRRGGNPHSVVEKVVWVRLPHSEAKLE